MTTAHATLFDRYLAQSDQDAAALLLRVCVSAGNEPPAGHTFVAPALRQARQALPGLAAAWTAHLARPAAAPPMTTNPASGFLTSGFGGPSGMSLMSDDDVDEDIESTRLVQAIEMASEWSLRDLRSRLASAPPTPGPARDEVLPLAPARVVGALCAALHEEPLTPGVRLAVLRTVAEPLSQGLARLYEQHAELLADWGLQPARYTIRREPEPRPAAGGPASGAVAVASAQIPALLAQVAGEAGLSPGMQALMARLAGPVSSSVAADGRLLESMDNPLWRLIDRLAALGQLDAGASADALQLPLHLRLEPIIARLEQAAQPMAVERYAQALAEAEAEALAVADAAQAAPAPLNPTGTAPLPALSEPVLVAEERRQALEPLVRAQMVARLRDVQVLPEVKQFLLGPWLGVVVKTVVEHGEEARVAQRALGAVEALIQAGACQRRAPLSAVELDGLRLEAQVGLVAAGGLSDAHVRQHVADLSAALATWPRPAPDTDAAASAEALFDEPATDPAQWPSHDELATVPIALDAHNPDERSMRDCEAWLDSLAEGDICRIQRQGQWATLRLNWRSEPGTYFAFGNSSGMAFCASRRVLGRMRLEGLATTVSRGQWVRRAVETLPMALDD